MGKRQHPRDAAGQLLVRAVRPGPGNLPHSSRRRAELWRKQKGRCGYCGQRCVKRRGEPNSWTVDHRVPKSRGGTHAKANLVGACHACNKAKGAADRDWRPVPIVHF